MYGFSKPGEYMFFMAVDSEWQSEYAWDVKNNTLYFRARNIKTGKVYLSRGRTKAVFENASWARSLF